MISWTQWAPSFWFVSISLGLLTNRDRPKSAPYPRLKNSKKTSKCQVLFYSTRESKFFEKIFSKKLHTQKNGPSGAPGLASASPWRAKVSQCRKTERGDPLRFFNIHSVAKHEKIEENKNFHFREKISQCRKKLKGGPFGIFQHPFCRKTSKKMQGDPLGKKFFFEKKVSQCRKNWKGGVFGLARYGMLRGKTGKTFLVQFARPNSAFWCNNIL